MNSREKLPRRLFLAGTFLLAIFLFYWHFGLLPGNLKTIAIRQIEALTHKKVTFDRVVALPFYGVRFDNLKIDEKNGSPIFICRRLRLNAEIVPFLKEKKIIINRVEIDSPTFDWQLEARKILVAAPPLTQISGQIPVPTLPQSQKGALETLERGPEALLPENVYLKEIWIRDGQVSVRKDARSALIEEIHSIHLRVNFEKPPVLAIHGSLKLGEIPYAAIGLQGTWNLDSSDYEFHTEAKSDKVPDWLLRYQSDHFLILKKGRFRMESVFRNVENTRALFKAKAELETAEISLHETTTTGRMSLEAKGLFNFDDKKFERTQGALNLVRVDVDRLSPEIERVEQITGLVEFEPDLLTIVSIRGEYKKLPFEAKGSVRSFQELMLSGEIRSRLRIEDALSLVPEEQKRLIKNFTISGDCEALTTLQGTLKKSSEIQAEYKLLVQNALMKSLDHKIQLSDLSAELFMNAQGLDIQNAHFISDKKPHALSAFIPKESGAPGTLRLTSENLELAADGALTDNGLTVQKARLAYFGIRSEFKGSISDLTRPFLKLDGDVQINLEKTSPLLESFDASLKNLGLSGGMKGYFILSGPADSLIDWDFKMDLEGGPGTFKRNLRFDTLSVQLRMKNRMIHLPYIHALAYGGRFGARVLFDCTKPVIFFDSRLSANKLNLALLGGDLKPESKSLAGIAIFQVALRGDLKKPETFRGQGAISLSNGKLWQTSLFKKMGELPLVRVEGLNWVVFHDLNATFDIHDERAWTQDLSVFSDTVDLSLKGSIGFKQDLDFLMSVQYSNNVFLGAQDAGGIAPWMVQQAADFISQYKVSGTLKEPKYEKIPQPVGNLIGKKIGSLIQTIAR